jgi:2-(3-amino-3-carboxypropyl)histidine synthase
VANEEDMEEDRAIADLGPDVVSADLNGEADNIEKRPKRRFIGRRAADAKAAAKAQENGSGIEESGAVQGAVTNLPMTSRYELMFSQSYRAADQLVP